MDARPQPVGAEGQPRMDLAALTRNARTAGAVLKALAHENRLLLLCLLTDGERSVGELQELLQLRQSAVSQQLARLRLDGLVKTRRDGKAVYYSIAGEDVRRILALLYEIYCASSAAEGSCA